MNTPIHCHLQCLAAVLVVCSSTILAGCLSLPRGEYDENERLCGERVREDHGAAEQIVVRRHYKHYYEVLAIDNHGNQFTSSERFFLKRGENYTPLRFLNGPRGEVATFFRPVEGTELWLAIREDKVVDMEYSNLTLMLFDERGIRRRMSLPMARRNGAYAFGPGNRNLQVELKGSRAVIDLTTGERIVPRKNGAKSDN